MTTTAPESTDTDSTLVHAMRLVAGYQMFGDLPGPVWADRVLTAAVESDRILNFTVTGSHTGVYGIQYVTFTVDVRTDDRRFRLDLNDRQMRDAGEALLNEVVGDSDVEVHWIAPLGYIRHPAA